MTASKRVYEPVAAALAAVYRQAVEMHAEGREEEAETLYQAVTGLTGEVKSAFWRDNIHFSGDKFMDAVYNMPYVFGTWYGGPSYSSGGGFMDDMERWDDLDAAKESLRYREGGRDNFTYVTETGMVDRDRSGWFDTPGATRESWIDLFWVYYDRTAWKVSDEPYKRLVFGPRGGVREESF